MAWPVLAGLMRLVIAALGGWVMVAELGGGLTALFGLVAAATITYGGLTAAALLMKGWAPPDALAVDSRGDDIQEARRAAQEGRTPAFQGK
jgi:hypothetical protein